MKSTRTGKLPSRQAQKAYARRPGPGAPSIHPSYANPELLFSEISPKRWGVLEAMSGAGEMSLRELARRLERDVKSVHRDVHALLETGLLEKTESGKIVCPFDKVRVDFTLAQAA